MADQSIITSIIGALSALGGASLGAWITTIRDERKEERLRQRDAKYLAVLVMGHLEKLIRECVTISWDVGVDENGYPAGERDNGFRFCKPTISAPKFDPLKLDVNWKALDADLLARIFDLPGELAHTERSVQAKVETAPSYPDPYDGEYFPYRRVLYAELAKRVRDIYRDLQATLGTNPVYLSRSAETGLQVEESLRAATEAMLRYRREVKEWHQKQASRASQDDEEEAARKSAAGQAPTGA